MSKKRIFSDQEKQYIITEYNNGKSLRKLEKELHVSRRILSTMLQKEKVTIKDNTINSRKYFHNENYFEKIDTEEKAYWLGFIYADGYIESKRKNNSQKFGITLNAKDINHLEKFKISIGATNPILRYVGSGYNPTGEFARLLMTSQKTVDDLKEKGVIELKTYDITFPTFEQVPEHLIHHFIRGYFDGDGCICYSIQNNIRQWQINFTGTYLLLEGINKFFNKTNKLYKHNNAFELKYTGTNQLLNIINILYKDATIYLDRKYDLIQDFIKNTTKVGV